MVKRVGTDGHNGEGASTDCSELCYLGTTTIRQQSGIPLRQQ